MVKCEFVFVVQKGVSRYMNRTFLVVGPSQFPPERKGGPCPSSVVPDPEWSWVRNLHFSLSLFLSLSSEGQGWQTTFATTKTLLLWRPPALAWPTSFEMQVWLFFWLVTGRADGWSKVGFLRKGIPLEVFLAVRLGLSDKKASRMEPRRRPSPRSTTWDRRSRIWSTGWLAVRSPTSTLEILSCKKTGIEPAPRGYGDKCIFPDMGRRSPWLPGSTLVISWLHSLFKFHTYLTDCVTCCWTELCFKYAFLIQRNVCEDQILRSRQFCFRCVLFKGNILRGRCWVSNFSLFRQQRRHHATQRRRWWLWRHFRQQCHKVTRLWPLAWLAHTHSAVPGCRYVS